MENMFDYVVRKHREELLSSAEARQLDDWQKQQVITIFNYLYHDPAVPMAWGTDKLTATIYNKMPAVKFSVNGFLFKGFVIVAYHEGTDFYKIFTSNVDGYKLQFNNVSFDCLVNFIDKFVETDDSKSDDYKNNVNNFINNRSDEEKEIIKMIFGKDFNN